MRARGTAAAGRDIAGGITMGKIPLSTIALIWPQRRYKIVREETFCQLCACKARSMDNARPRLVEPGMNETLQARRGGTIYTAQGFRAEIQLQKAPLRKGCGAFFDRFEAGLWGILGAETVASARAPVAKSVQVVIFETRLGMILW